MTIDLVPLLSFALVTTFTPGPNNISSASMGVLFGYRRSLGYLLGIASGFFLVMLICAGLSTTLLRIVPSLERVLRIVGAVYILWLAFSTLRTSYAFETDAHPPMGFGSGFALQPLNPKVAIYGLTIYSTFLASLDGHPAGLAASAFLLAANAFCAISSWALFGAAIRKYLRQTAVKRLVNTVLALLLVYTAVDLSGIFS